jgi:hypothetical protein
LTRLIGPASAFFIVILIVMLAASVGRGGQTAAALRVTARDGSGRPVESAQVRVRSRGEAVCAARTNARGEASCPHLAPGSYEVAIEKEGFETLSRAGVEIAPGAALEVAFTLVPRIELKEGVTIEGGAASPVEAGASAPATELRRDQLYQLASRPTTVADALPLVPGVSRSPNGEINMSGSGEHRSALIVNAADVTDPATGQFGMTIPVDSVERIEVFKSPFLAQYGRFTAGVVAVETRRGTDEWHFDVHDPLPAFRFRSGRLAGLLNASPRIVFNGPLIKNRLYLSEGIEYRLFKDPVRTLPHPNRETKSESVNSFTQLDARLHRRADPHRDRDAPHRSAQSALLQSQFL